MENIWNHVAFIDSDEWAEHVQKFGVPLIKTKSRKIPENIGKGLFLDFNNKLRWMQVIGCIRLEFGLPYQVLTHTIIETIYKAISK